MRKLTLTIGPVEFSAAHSLPAEMSQKCSAVHGHNYWAIVCIAVFYSAETAPLSLAQPGIVVEASRVKSIIRQLDHKNLNDLFIGPSTAERIAEYLFSELADLVRECVLSASHAEMHVTVSETSEVAVCVEDTVRLCEKP